MLVRQIVPAGIAGLVFALPGYAALQLSYDFNGSGTTAVNGGVAGANGDLLLKDPAGAPLDLHGAAGSGVSGAPGDKALDLTRYTYGFDAGYGQTATTGSELGVLGINGNDGIAGDRLTVAAWYRFKPDNDVDDLGYRSNSRVTGGLHEVRASNNNGQFVYANASSYASDTDSAWAVEGEWVFVAVVVDETTDSVRWYRGTTDTAVSLVQESTAATGDLVATNASIPLYVGNRSVSSSNNRVLDGWIDNVSLFNDAQSLAQLEALRQSAIPEPASLTAFAAGALALRRRRPHA